MRNARLASAPVAKSVSGFSQNETRVYRDSVPFTSDEAAGSTFSLFQGQADPGEVAANYLENPLPRQNSHDVVALGFGLQPSIRADQVDFDPIQAYQAFTQSFVEFSTSERQTLLKKEGTELIEIEDHEIKTVMGQTVVRAAANEGAIRLEDPIRIESQEVFDLELETALPGFLPSASQYNSVSGGVVSLVAFMEVILS